MTAQEEQLEYAPPSGPHPVGVVDGEVLDTTYPVTRPEDAAGRRMMVRVWYPAAGAEGSRRPYFESAERDTLVPGLIQGMPLPSLPDLLARMAVMQTYSVAGARIAAGRRPTLIFSHGGTSYVSQNTPLMEHLASHGYIVWSVTHPGESGAILYPDGTSAGIDAEFIASLMSMVGDESYTAALTGDIGQRLAARREFTEKTPIGPRAQRWADDSVAVVDAIEAQTVTGEAASIVPLCDLSNLGLFGMSFGGAASASAAQKDPRVRAAVNLDGGQFLTDLLDTDIRVPLLMINSEISKQLGAMGIQPTFLMYNEFFFEPVATMGTRPDIQRLLVPGATHLELTDFALIPAEERAAALPGAGETESRRLVDIMNTFIGAFFDHSLLGAENGYPDHQLAQFPEVLPIDVSPLREWALQSLAP